MRNQRSRSGFGAGVAVGIIFCLALVFVLFARYRTDGIMVTVDLEHIAVATRQEIEGQVAQLLPAVLDNMKAQVPRQVAAELSTKLGMASFSLYGITVKLPDESMHDIRQQIEKVVTAELQASLDKLDIEQSAAHWGEQGEALITRSLQRELGGRNLALQPWPAWPWLQLPVVLRVRGP